ncbi:hypothetical protein O0L34_g6873 [Tuta absoluta]|nr:hypothetical protein O0L34_g6873 [Tuta absoluta]
MSLVIKSEPEIKDEAINDYKESLKKNAENLLLKGFPAKIVQLNELLTKLNYHNNVNLDDFHQDVNIPVPTIAEERDMRGRRKRVNETILMTASVDWPKVYTLPKGPSPCNKPLTNLIQTVKPHFQQLFEDANTLKMWISCLIPKVEDGNNFGVTIQAVTLKEIHAAEAEATAFLNDITEYFADRAKVVSKVAKYPHIEDFRRAVKELDESEYLALWYALHEVRNSYCVLHDIVTKNLDKIKKPRVSHIEALY